jgi:hypothetical protein
MKETMTVLNPLDVIAQLIADPVNRLEVVNSESDTLLKIVESVRGSRRLPYKKIEFIILQLCQNRYLTPKELGELLQRNMTGLRDRFLAPIVKRGLLSLLYPETPSHMQQAYYTNKALRLKEREDPYEGDQV